MSTTPTPAGGISDLVASQIRTYVPLVVAAIVGWLASLGITLDAGPKEFLASVLGFIAGLIWYVIVRSLERRWPSLGWLLGYPKQPTYIDAGTAGQAPATITTVK